MFGPYSQLFLASHATDRLKQSRVPHRRIHGQRDKLSDFVSRLRRSLAGCRVAIYSHSAACPVRFDYSAELSTNFFCLSLRQCVSSRRFGNLA